MMVFSLEEAVKLPDVSSCVMLIRVLLAVKVPVAIRDVLPESLVPVVTRVSSVSLLSVASVSSVAVSKGVVMTVSPRPVDMSMERVVAVRGVILSVVRLVKVVLSTVVLTVRVAAWVLPDVRNRVRVNAKTRTAIVLEMFLFIAIVFLSVGWFSCCE